MGVGAQRPPPQPWGTPRPLYLCAVSPSGPQHPSLETPSLSRDCSTSPNHSLLICQMGAQAPRLGPWWGGWWLSSKALASAGVTTEPGSGTQDDDAHGACLGMLNRRKPLAEREPDPWSPSDKRETVSHSPAPPRAALPPRKPRSPSAGACGPRRLAFENPHRGNRLLTLVAPAQEPAVAAGISPPSAAQPEPSGDAPGAGPMSSVASKLISDFFLFLYLPPVTSFLPKRDSCSMRTQRKGDLLHVDLLLTPLSVSSCPADPRSALKALGMATACHLVSLKASRIPGARSHRCILP